MFPQVAAKFFATRHLGPKNLGKDPAIAAAAAAPAPTAGATTASNLTNPQNYLVTLNGKEHRVTVAPAK
jgi:methylmalonyl-CoA carboxyltransferase 5S subunit